MEVRLAKKRVYEVVNNNANKKGLRVGRKFYRYGRNGMFTVKDPEVGKEIKKQYDLDAVVNEVELQTNIEPGHTYTFGSSKKYAEAWEAFEKRRKENENKSFAKHKPRI